MSEFPPLSLKPLAQEVSVLLKSKSETVAVAETACGGLISATLLSAPGASAIYKGGLTLYTLPSRICFAGWTQANIKGYKGPTPAIVAQLAVHTRAQLESTYCISESGTAGPTGGETKNRTPGYCALAVSTPNGTVTREIDTQHGKRDENMVEFAKAALELLRDVLSGTATPDSAGVKSSV